MWKPINVRVPKNEAKDGWVKVRVTLEGGAAGNVLPERVFPRVKVARKTATKKIVAANGEQKGRHMRGYTDAKHSGVRAWTHLSSQCSKSSELETLWCCMKRIRTSETLENGTMIKLDVNQWSVHKWACEFVSIRQVQFAADMDGEWPNRFRQACKSANIVWRWRSRDQSI